MAVGAPRIALLVPRYQARAKSEELYHLKVFLSPAILAAYYSTTVINVIFNNIGKQHIVVEKKFFDSDGST